MSPKRAMERRNHGCAMRQHGKNRKRLAEIKARGEDALRECEDERLRERIVASVVSMERGGAIGCDYVRRIAEACADEVAEDVSVAADPQRWNDDDVRMAFGRVLARRIGADGK